MFAAAAGVRGPVAFGAEAARKAGSVLRRPLRTAAAATSGESRTCTSVSTAGESMIVSLSVWAVRTSC